MKLRPRNVSIINARFSLLIFITLALTGTFLPVFLTSVSGQSTSSVITEYQIPTSNSGPEAIISAPNQVFWFTEYNAGKIGELFGQNGTIHDFKVNATGANPDSLAMDSQGRIWFSDPSKPGAIWMFNPNALVFRRFNITANSFPLSIFIDQANNTWFTEATTDKIGEILYPIYSVKEYPVTPGSGPAVIAHQSGTPLLWISETYSNKIAEFNMTSHALVREFAPNPAPISPLGIVLDQSSNIWIAEHGGSSVDEFFPSSSTLQKHPTSPATGGYTYTAPATVAVDTKGRIWFVEHLADRVGRLDPASNTLDEFNGVADGSYSVLNTLDSSGNFWFTQYTANEIGMIPANAVGQQQNFQSITGIISSYLPEILVAAAGIAGVTYVVFKRRISKSRPTEHIGSVGPVSILIATVVTATLLDLVILSAKIGAPQAKCIGAPPPNPSGGGSSSGLDYFSVALDIGALAFFAVVAYLLWRDWRRNKGSGSSKKAADTPMPSPSNATYIPRKYPRSLLV
jgi:virginiamycin B lyase